jgi:ATP-dependent helicase Lhr and Lhr-like helicase
VGIEAWPQPQNADEMHEALMSLGGISGVEARDNPHWMKWLENLARAGRATRLQITSEDALWIPLERLTCLQALYPAAEMHPALAALAGFDEAWHEDEARIEILRARLSGFGPLPIQAIAEPLAMAPGDVAQGLAQLENQGYVLRGRFSPGTTEEQWCERHLLSRIHRYTVKRLRREIEPVSLQDFTRFLFDWQHLSASTISQGKAALPEVVDQLEGFSAAAGAWDSDILPARLKDYSQSWLDDLCRSGKVVWMRLTSRNKVASVALRSTPIVLLPRPQVRLWTGLTEQTSPEELSLRAQKVHQVLSENGAMFFDELTGEAHLLRTELENALQELVGAGLVNADSFAGLRALVTPASKRATHTSRRNRGAFIGGMDDAGRWALLRRAPTSAAPARLDNDTLEHIAMTLLRRYGVVFWRLLEREADWLPTWRELLRTFHRLEARGEIRGGRFVAGLAGEQFALPEAIPLLREVRKRPLDGSLIGVSGVDPLNLAGTLLPGAKVPAVVGNRLVYRDGIPIAAIIAGKPQYWGELDPQVMLQVRDRLFR